MFHDFIVSCVSSFHRFRAVNGFIVLQVSWFDGFIGFVVSMVSWFHRFRGFVVS